MLAYFGTPIRSAQCSKMQELPLYKFLDDGEFFDQNPGRGGRQAQAPYERSSIY